MGDVSWEIEDNIAVITVDAPEVRNALTPEMGHSLSRICDEIDADLSVGAAVIRGAHGTFCSGADRRTWQPNADQASDEQYKQTGAVYGAFARLGELKVPLVAAIRGAAVGAGLNLMLAADLRVVALDARILAGFVRIGLHPGGGYFALSGRLAGREATAAMGIFGEEITGERATELGLAWEALSDEKVESRAMQLASSAATDPELIREVVRSFRAELGPPTMPWSTALEFERGTQMWSQRRRAEP